jgi:hypothetical protein
VLSVLLQRPGLADRYSGDVPWLSGIYTGAAPFLDRKAGSRRAAVGCGRSVRHAAEFSVRLAATSWVQVD